MDDAADLRGDVVHSVQQEYAHAKPMRTGTIPRKVTPNSVAW
ncbi:hypothetical protein [Haloglomus irregulare]|nr:hypothetical protein [Haloglomus irregulare]